MKFVYGDYRNCQVAFNEAEEILRERFEDTPVYCNWKEFVKQYFDIRNQALFEILYFDEMIDFLEDEEPYSINGDVGFDRDDVIKAFENLKDYIERTNVVA